MEGVTSSEIEAVLEEALGVTSSGIIMNIYGNSEMFLWDKFLNVSAVTFSLDSGQAKALMLKLLALAVRRSLDDALNEVFSFLLFFFFLSFFFLLILSRSSRGSCRVFRS